MPRSPGIPGSSPGQALPCDCAGRLRGFADSASLRWQRTGRHPAGHPAGLFSACPPRHRGPGPARILRAENVGAHPVRDHDTVAHRVRSYAIIPLRTAGYRSGNARSARMPGCPSLWLLSLGQTRESDPRAARRAQTSNQRTQRSTNGQRSMSHPRSRREADQRRTTAISRASSRHAGVARIAGSTSSGSATRLHIARCSSFMKRWSMTCSMKRCSGA